jgi:hypothetical protein
MATLAELADLPLRAAAPPPEGTALWSNHAWQQRYILLAQQQDQQLPPRDTESSEPPTTTHAQPRLRLAAQHVARARHERHIAELRAASAARRAVLERQARGLQAGAEVSVWSSACSCPPAGQASPARLAAD